MGKTKAWPIIGLLIFSALIYGAYLRRTIRYDEAYTLHHYTSDPLVSLFDWSTPNNHKLYSLLVWGARWFIQDHLIALRLPAYLSALAGIYLAYRLGLRQSRATGLVIAVSLATNPMYAFYAVNGRAYTLTIMLLLAFLLVENRALLSNLSGALLLALPTNVLVLVARFEWPVAVGAFAGGLFYLPALFNGQLRANAGWSGNTPAEALFEWSNMFRGTGALVLCLLVFQGWLVLWRSRARFSSSKRFLPARSFLAEIISTYSPFFAYGWVILCLIVGLATLPAVLGAGAEVDQIKATLDQFLQPSDGIIGGEGIVDDPLMEIYPTQFGDVDAHRVFVVARRDGFTADITGCKQLSNLVYLCQ